MEASSRSLAERQRNTGTREDPVDAIYQIIVNFMTQRRLEEVKISEVEPQIRAKGFTEEQLKACVAEYEDINVWQSHAGTRLLEHVLRLLLLLLLWACAVIPSGDDGLLSVVRVLNCSIARTDTSSACVTIAWLAAGKLQLVGTEQRA
eukprot:COSAG05_NODE_120_length_17734_cov_79.637823_5_plen_148_part_00